jgi:hypothetical protein
LNFELEKSLFRDDLAWEFILNLMNGEERLVIFFRGFMISSLGLVVREVKVFFRPVSFGPSLWHGYYEDCQIIRAFINIEPNT